MLQILPHRLQLTLIASAEAAAELSTGATDCKKLHEICSRKQLHINTLESMLLERGSSGAASPIPGTSSSFRCLQMALQRCVLKNRAIPLKPRLPTPYDFPSLV
jgi:hypothetical protein